MRDVSGVQAVDDLALLAAAVLAFSLFFGAFAEAYVAREARARGERLEALADDLLAAVLDDPRWTVGHGRIDEGALLAAGSEALRPVATGLPFEIVVWNLATGSRWTVADGDRAGTWRTAATAASLIGDPTEPGRIAATVWEP